MFSCAYCTYTWAETISRGHKPANGLVCLTITGAMGKAEAQGKGVEQEAGGRVALVMKLPKQIPGGKALQQREQHDLTVPGGSRIVWLK